MKIVVIWITLIGLAIATASSCSVKHPSEQYACETQADCEALGEGRVCSDGLCVVPGGGKLDAGVVIDAAKRDAAMPDASVCPAGCTSCDHQRMECVVDCSMSPNGCSTQIVCPVGWACTIKCNVANSCRNGVNCLMSTACNVECSGNSSCRNVACGTGPCKVGCTGTNSCRGISCGASCACDVTCPQAALCDNVICTSLQCDTFDGGCTSSRTGCETCP